MSRVLDLGAGPRSNADEQIDLYKWPRTTVVMDIVNVPWPFEDNSFEEVRAEQVLEHIPGVAYFKENGVVTHINPRVMVMKEIYRVLKKGGVLHASVPEGDDAFNQDPTHIGPKWTDGMFNYFCGQWGGNTPGEFVHDAYGVDFSFTKIASFMTGPILTVKLVKI